MKNPILFSSFLLITLSQNLLNPAQAAPSWLRKVAGTYQGQIWSGGVLLPTTTKFAFNTDGSLAGTYDADEGDLIIPGTLSNCQAVKGRQIACIWDDFYGRGSATFTFNPKFSNFEGSWTEATIKDRYPWRGSR